MVLSSNDMRVILAQSGAELSKTIVTEMPHLILIDWDEEGIDGRSNLRAIRTRQESRKIPVLVMTNVAVTEHLTRELGMLGVQWILEKPIVPLSLPKLIVRTISGVSASGQSIVPRGRAFLVNCGQTATGVQWQAV
jgi:CheY-like chemotaxis protein